MDTFEKILQINVEHVSLSGVDLSICLDVPTLDEAMAGRFGGIVFFEMRQKRMLNFLHHPFGCFNGTMGFVFL